MGHFENRGEILFDGKDWEDLSTDDVYDYFEDQFTREDFDEYLNSGYNQVEIGGCDYNYSYVYKTIDEEGYEEAFDDWVWNECEYYIKDDLLRACYYNDSSDWIYGLEIEYINDDEDDESDEEAEEEMSFDAVFNDSPATVNVTPIVPEFVSEFAVLISN